MKITKNYLTNNKCYKTGKKITPKGIMLHSTACKGVKAATFLKSWNTYQPNGKSVCVHAFLDDTGVYQTLPFNYRAWHCAGTGNDTHIGFEICEPKDYADKKYFETVKNLTIDFCLHLMKLYNLKYTDITSHCEAHKKKGKAFASNHGDVDHWWKKYHNYTMDNFRADVKKKLEQEKKGDEEDMLRYNKLEELPDYAKPTIKKLIDKGALKGDGAGLDLSQDMVRIFVINDRLGLYN